MKHPCPTDPQPQLGFLDAALLPHGFYRTWGLTSLGLQVLNASCDMTRKNICDLHMQGLERNAA